VAPADELKERVIKVAQFATACILVPWAWIGGTFRWLIGSASGVLVLALSAYFYLRRTSLSRPLAPSELLAWFAAERYEVKVAILGALLTMIGFAIAFWTASATWTRQKELELRIEAHKAVLRRFQRAIRLLNGLDAYLHVLITALRTLTPRMPEAEIGRHVAFSNSQAMEFSKSRQELYAAMLDVYELYGEYASIFANVVAVPADLKRAAAAIEAAQQALASIVPPLADPNAPGFVQTFLSRCNLEVLEAAHAECARAREVASGIYGRASGILIHAIVKPNFWALIHVTRMGRVVGRIALLGRIKGK
jgi:hypothetical protein